jgi:hypothetical protein
MKLYQLYQIKKSLLFCFFCTQFSHSQLETNYKGKVLSDNFPIEKVELINLNTEKSAFSNNVGEFSIVAKPKDIIVFASKLYEVKRIVIQPENLNNPLQIISLIKKPEELNEVIVKKINWKRVGSNKNASSQIALDKMQSQIKNPFIYDGSITNGMDFIQIGRLLIDLFKKDKDETKRQVPEIPFDELAKSAFYEEYCTKTLKLKTDQIALFLQFCDVDPKSKMVAKNYNTLGMMDFLFQKSIEFKKL